MQSSQWIVQIDTARTDPSEYTSFKTTYRDMYENARSRAGITSFTQPNEVLIVSTKDDEVMEGSLTTPYFWRNGRWVTPPIASGGQIGTTRRYLLERGMCVEESVRAETLQAGEECWISNGVRGLVWAKVGPNTTSGDS